MKVSIRLEGVVVRRGRWIIVRVSRLDLESGEYVCISGASGSGKSTLLRVLALIQEPSEGVVYVNGRIVGVSDGSRLRRELIAYLPQDNLLIDSLTVGENIALPLILRGLGVAEALVIARHIASKLGLESLLDRSPGEISGGEARRVMLARSLASDKRVLLLDEPTAGLDDESARLVYSLLADEVEKDKLVVHVEPVFPDYAPCTRIITMKAGVTTSES